MVCSVDSPRERTSSQRHSAPVLRRTSRMEWLAPRKKKPPGSQPRGDQGAGAPLAMIDSYVATADAERQCDESRPAVDVESRCYFGLSMSRGCLSPAGNLRPHRRTRATRGCRRSADRRQRNGPGTSAALPQCHCLQRLTGFPNPPSLSLTPGGMQRTRRLSPIRRCPPTRSPIVASGGPPCSPKPRSSAGRRCFDCRRNPFP